MSADYVPMTDDGVALAAAAAIKVVDKAKRSAPRTNEAAEPATHYELARRWLEHLAIEGHEPIYCGGMFFAPRADQLWQALSIPQAETKIAALFTGEKLCRKGSDYRQIAGVAAALAEDPTFFEGAPAGVVTLAGFHRLGDAGTVQTVPLRLDDRQVFRLQWAPIADCPRPLFDGLLATALAGDDEPEQRALMQQLFGAILFGQLPRLQTVGLFIGREGSGKSTLQRLLEQLFPADVVSAVSPAAWAREYNVASLMGKRLNVVGELSDDAPIPAAAFKNVTGQNLIEGRHPTHRPFYFTCTASHLFASNVLPPTTDRTDAFFRRWRVVVFRNRVTEGKADPDLLDKILAAEVPGILAWAFEGAEIVARDGLLTTAAHGKMIAKWKAAANPVLQYLLDDEAVELDPHHPGPTTREVYEHYRRWSSAAGFRNPFGRNHFLELLDATGGQVGVAVKRTTVSGLRLVRAND